MRNRSKQTKQNELRVGGVGGESGGVLSGVFVFHPLLPLMSALVRGGSLRGFGFICLCSGNTLKGLGLLDVVVEVGGGGLVS